LYLVQVNAAVSAPNPEQSIPSDLQALLNQFAQVFDPPSELPPSRHGDHSIPLLDGAQSFCL
jgi:hypothetical protein